jgi:RNA polymerase-interacting CarD/CdnL/TRCF family regulator
MSIRSQTPGIASDIPLHERDHQSNYDSERISKKKSYKLPQGQINNISSYVKKNLSKISKPRGQENR